jgi:hypothetical protein
LADNAIGTNQTCRSAEKRAIPRRCALSFLLSLLLLFVPLHSFAQTTEPAAPTSSLPDAPKPAKAPAPLPPAGPCQVRNAGGSVAATGSEKAAYTAGFGDVDAHLTNQPVLMSVACPAYVPIINWYARFLDGPKVKPLTPKEKAWLAIRNVGDPFNAITILGTSGIGIASDPHSAYGPGMPGFSRSVGVAYAQDMTGEFFGTFLIPSIVHQDPHYHREPGASIKRRIGHAILQVVWTQGDNSKGMINYANLVGFAIDDEVSNLYVPGRSTNLPASSARYAIGLALAPTDNFITEFIPDIAKHIHVQVVLVQRIINQVAKTDGAGGS